LNKAILIFTLTVSPILAESGWYLANTCESIKEFKMESPLDFISEYRCKPNNGKGIEVSSDLGMLSFDCTNSELSGYMNVVFGKERCLLVKKTTEKRIKNKGVR